MIAALLGKTGEEITGRGYNISDDRLQHNISVSSQSLQRAGLSGKKTKDPRQVLSEVSALVLGAMAGAMLPASAIRRLVLLDGFLSYSAALLATMINPKITDYIGAPSGNFFTCFTKKCSNHCRCCGRVPHPQFTDCD